MTHIVIPREPADILRETARLRPDDLSDRAQLLRRAAAEIQARQAEDADDDTDGT